MKIKTNFIQWLKDLVRLYLPVYQYESDTMKIAYAGYSSIKMNYLSHLFLDKTPPRTFLGRRWFWQIPYLVKSGNFDIVISEISSISFNHCQIYNGYWLPVWAKMRINIDRPMGEICKDSISDFSDVMRKIRKYNLTYEILTDNESFNHFKNNMYLPYITKRFGEEAMIDDLNMYFKMNPTPILIAIKENGMLVAACLIRKDGDFLHLIRLGLLDGKEEYRLHGVIGAIYYFSIIEAQKLGCKYLDVGGTRPFLTNGLTKFKMGLGGEFVSEYSSQDEYFMLIVNKNSIIAEEIMQSNPFVYVDKHFSLNKS